MFITNVISIILLVLTTKNLIVVGQCFANIKNDIVRKVDPVFLRFNELWAPTGDTLDWKAGQITKISCPGIDNTVLVCKPQTQPAIEIRCLWDKTFDLADGTLVHPNELVCKKAVTADIQLFPNDKCLTNTNTNMNDILTLKIGFVALPSFHPYIIVCYNKLTGVPVYTEHKISGSAIKYKVISGERPSFNKQHSPTQFNINEAYKKKSQKNRLIQLLGQQKADYYFPKEMKDKGFYFARGHLTPDADGIFNSWQTATYYYVNVAPQWQIINEGNWKRVEDAVRNFAAKFQRPLHIITGVHETLTLEDENNNQVDISLANNGGLKVPKWFWKIVKSDLKAIVFVTLNNPHVRSPILCPNICERYGWNHASYLNVTLGYTYCCSLHDFKLAVTYLPSRIHAKDILPWDMPY